MDDMDHTNAVTEDVAETSIKKRPRKKHLYRQILKQMEFYFSNANLSRDIFLNQLLEENKNVPLEIFLRFNKIRDLTRSTEEIANALRSSELLKLTDDGKCVYRTTAIEKKENQDECMIYVEQLPSDANHDWLIGIFSAYGKVEYVSIPKHKNKATIKGFGFVEFDTPEAAKRALEAFGSAGCCLPPQINPEKLCSIATFERDDSDDPNIDIKDDTDVPEMKTKKLTKKVEFELEEELAESEEPKMKKLNFEVVKGKKRKLEIENAENHLSETKYCTQETTSEDVSKKKKKRKNLAGEEVIGEGKEETVESEEVSAMIKIKKKKKHQKMENGSEETKRNPEEMDDEFDDGMQRTKKKKKKLCEVENEDADKDEDADDEGTSERTHKQTEEDEENTDYGETGVVSEKSDKKRARKRTKSKKKKNLEKKENDPASLGLRIISKIEWRRLRNKYLALQREKMQGLKTHLARVKYGSSYQSPYRAKDKGCLTVKEDPEAKKTKYMPGVIIHMQLAEPLEDVKSFKKDAKLHPGVMYVDATTGSPEVHIRCDSAEDAQKLIGTKPWDNMKILEGKAEQQYWDKIWVDREDKKSGKIRVNARGREKLLKRAERELGKHIKFDD